MKTNLTTILGGVACGLALGLTSASAGLITVNSTTQNGGTPINVTVPDGSSVGIFSLLNISSADNIVSIGDNVSVTFTMSGGFNGDLYAYLLSPTGTRVQLLDRPGLTGDSAGLGYTTHGFDNVHLSDGSHDNINTTPTPTTGGTYMPSDGSTAFQSYNGLNPNGNWVLFLSDLNGGDTSFSRLDSWSLTLEVVPEPVNVALGVFGGLFGLVSACRYGWRRYVRDLKSEG